MFETMVARWVAIISTSHIPCYSLLTYRPLLAHWASHVQQSLSFLLPCLHFYIGIGALWCMNVSFRSFMSLGPTNTSFSHYFFLPSHYSIPSYLIGCVLHLFFVLFATCSASSFLHPKWWSFSIHYMEYSHIIFIIYPIVTYSEILSFRRSSC